MKKIFVKSILFGLAAISVLSCSDQSDEITNVTYKRNFSPNGVEAKVRNRTNVELSWNSAEGVTSYDIKVYADDSLTYDFSKAPVLSTTVTPDKNPLMITGLMGETKYSFYIMAKDGNESRNSKWQGAFAKTESEQIFKNVAEEDIQAKQVTLRWTAGQAADLITLTPGDIKYTVTAADVAAGAATITGLTPETEYSAVLTYQGKTRGKISFTTGIYLEDNDILVKAGDDLSEIIANADAGKRLVIDAGEYGLKTAEADFGGSVTISKKLSIKGLRPNSLPVIKGRFKVEAEFNIDQVILDGEGTDGGQAFDFTAEGEIESFSITNSEIKNFTKGFYYMNKATLVKTITIENNIISKIECSGGDFMDARKGGFNTLSFKNNTVYESALSRDFIRMDDNSANVTAAANIILDHNTLYNVGSGGANYRIFYVRWKSGNKITFTNNLVVNTNYKRGFANQGATDKEPTLDNNVYFNTENLISAGATADATITWFDANGKNLDPKFADAAKGDFTVTNDEVKDTKAGDPRWIK